MQEIESYPKERPVAGIRAALSDLGGPNAVSVALIQMDCSCNGFAEKRLNHGQLFVLNGSTDTPVASPFAHAPHSAAIHRAPG